MDHLQHNKSCVRAGSKPQFKPGPEIRRAAYIPKQQTRRQERVIASAFRPPLFSEIFMGIHKAVYVSGNLFLESSMHLFFVYNIKLYDIRSCTTTRDRHRPAFSLNATRESELALATRKSELTLGSQLVCERVVCQK